MFLQTLPRQSDNKVSFSNSKSFLFDGVDEYIDIPDDPTLRFGTNDFTIGIWFKADPTVAHKSLICKGSGGTNNISWEILIRNTTSGILRFRASNANQVQYDGNFHDDLWHFGLVTRIGTLLSLYADGLLVDTKTVTFDFSTTDAMYMGRRFSNNRYMIGNLDEPFVANGKGFSQAEVTEAYNGGTPMDLTQHSSFNDITSWWRMGDDPLDDSTGITGNIQDQIGTNHGTPINTEAGDIVENIP